MPNKLHPLHTPDLLDSVVRSSDCYFDPERAPWRSKILALGFIQQALKNPHTWIQVDDHDPSYYSAMRLTYDISQMAQVLGIKYITGIANGYICFGTCPSTIPTRTSRPGGPKRP